MLMQLDVIRHTQDKKHCLVVCSCQAIPFAGMSCSVTKLERRYCLSQLYCGGILKGIEN